MKLFALITNQFSKKVLLFYLNEVKKINLKSKLFRKK